MTKIKIVSLLLFHLFIVPEQANAQQTPVPDGRRLREIVADKFPDGNLLIGATTGEWAFGTGTGEIMDREFNYVTPENDFKQPTIYPDNSGKWSWSRPDNWKSHVISNGQTLRMHGPISPQCSNWAKDDTRTADELETNMRAFMQALCERYNGQANFEYMDVVNETVIDGSWHKNKEGTGWEVPWFKIGQDTDENKTPLYIKYAFEIATQYAPDIKLVLNQHEKTIIDSSWNLIKKTITYIRNLGFRVDAIGWQAHLNTGWEIIEGQPQALRDLIDWAHQNNLEFHITEQSAFINSNTDEDYKKQAETYKAIIDILIEKSANGKVRWNTWHIDDGHGNNADKFPAIFDSNYSAKPAYYAIQLALETKGDYASSHNVSVHVKNTESGQEIENCKIIFNNEIKYSDNNGEALFQATANQYSLEAEKRHHRKVAIENLSIYSDTIFNVFLDSAEVFYKVNFELEDKETGEKSSSVNIEIDSKSLKTDLGGTADFTLNPGSFQTYFTKLNYADFQQEFIINSDTTFIVKMNRSHADFKFSVRNGNQPINNALVIFAGDSLYTGSLGICTFRSYPVDSLFNYMIEKEFYFSTVGSITTKTDSVIEIQLQKSAVNIGFVLSGDKEKVDNPIIVIKNDTAVFNQEGTVKLYNVKLNQVIEYEIFSDNYPDYSASLFPEKDTLLYIQLLYTGIENEVKNKKLNIYPNPATEYLIIESDLEFDYIEIANINGMTIKEIRHQSLNCKVDISDLEAGYYIIRFVTTRDIKSRSFIKQER